MKIVLFDPHESYSEFMIEELKDRGYELENIHECLCDLVHHELKKNWIMPENVFCHPHSEDGECTLKIKKIVENFPNTKFYLFAFQKPKIKETIGTHKNVIYIDHNNSLDVLGEAFK